MIRNEQKLNIHISQFGHLFIGFNHRGIERQRMQEQVDIPLEYKVKRVSGRLKSERKHWEREGTYDLDGRDLWSTPSHLRSLDTFNNLVPHTSDKNLLLLGVCADRDSRKESPNRFVVKVGLRAKSVDRLVLSDAERYRGSHASRREHWEKGG